MVPAGVPSGLPSSHLTRAQSAQPPPSDTGHGRPPGSEAELQRKTSNSYGHHRQTSVIHGVQHSRNPSFNSGSTASPLSPETLASVLNNTKQQSALRRPDGPSGVGSPASDGRLNMQITPTGSASDFEAATMSQSNGYGHSKRPTMTSRSRRPHGRGQSSAQGNAEARTPSEYALHHLFNAFVVHADHKINQCIANIDNVATPVEQTCGPGVDPALDQLISALGHVARSAPKPLVDSLMLWRKAKGDAASAAKRHMQQQRMPGHLPAPLPRRNTEPVHANGPNQLQATDIPTAQNSTSAADEYSLADRRATVSVFLLCRALIEVFAQSSLEAISADLARKLEDIVFSQLRDVDPVHIMNSSLRLANWRIYGQVLGQISGLDFPEVTSKFTNELDHCQQEIARSPGSTSAKDAENRAELLILGMRHIQVNSGPNWSASCDFLRTLGSLFVSAHGPRIKQAYCQVLERLLLPLAADPSHFLEEQRWREFIETTNERLNHMLGKVRHFHIGFPLSIMLLCVSPREALSNYFIATVQTVTSKHKDRSTRGMVLQAISRLTWSYLHRVVDENPSARHRKIEEVIKLVLPLGRRAYLSTESFIAEPLIHLTRIIGFWQSELCFRQIIFPLLNAEMFLSTKDPRIEQMEPERIAIGIRAFLSVIEDQEKDEPTNPSFPLSSPPAPLVEPLPTSPTPSEVGLLSDAQTPTTAKEMVSLRPIDATKLPEASKQYYSQFRNVLGKIVIACDNAFGGHATLNERLFATNTPKTPLADAFTFARKDDPSGIDQKQFYYDLLHVAIQALPRCLLDHVPPSHLNLLCTGSAHIQPAIANSSAQSLRAIATQGHAQAVAIAFSKFIFEYDKDYSTLSDEGMLGPGHIETTLTLYLELLQIWIADLQRRSKGASAQSSDNHAGRMGTLGLTNVYPHVDQIEAHGLFFLCSQSRRVRGYAVKVLRLVTEFDQVLGQSDSARIIKILESEGSRVLTVSDESLTVAERSRLQKDKRRGHNQNTLIEICSSEMTYDSTLWAKVFPNLIRITFETCPNAIALCRGQVTHRLIQLHPSIEEMSVLSKASLTDYRPAMGRSVATPPEVLIEQWKLYLILACVTLSGPGGQSQSQLANAVHSRKGSKNTPGSEQLSSARSLFSAVIPLLAAAPDLIRNAVVVALGSINRKLYRTLLESLQYAVIRCNDEAKSRIGAHQRTPSSPQRSQQTSRLRTEVTHVYKLTSVFLRDPDVYSDEWILNNLVTYAKDLRIFLNAADVQHHEWEFQRLRIHYCGLIEELFDGINQTRSPSRWMPFESRKSAFSLMEDWCGYSADTSLLIQREEAMTKPQNHEPDERSNVNAATEIEKKNLRLAALSAMAALCAGPLSIRTESGTVLSFQLSRILSWIESILATATDRMQSIGRRGLKLLILHNREQPSILEHAVDCCYKVENTKALDSYFSVVAEILIEHQDYPFQFWRILGAVIFTLGNENREIRMKSTRLLRILDDRQLKSSKLQDFDISISDKTTAVYKLAQFEYSKRLAKAHSEIAFKIFSEFSLHFKYVNADAQRNMVAAILPWIQTLELQVDPNGGPTAVSYMLLSNMFEITIRSGGALHNEVQALWQALATGPHAGNVQLILDFVISLSLNRREQNFVEYAKQIIVYLSGTLAGSRVIEFFLLQLVPKNMVNEKRSSEHISPDLKGLPYVADMSSVLPMGNKQAGLSLGQVSVIFLVDLLVAPVALSPDSAIKLIHVVMILWDHYITSVQEQAREMLVHLIHELVTAKITDEELSPRKHKIEQLVETIRGNDETVSWSYEENTGKTDESTGSRVPRAMIVLCKEVKDLFRLSYDVFEDLWAKEALIWASSCPVRHLACRSFQVFRCISVSIDNRMLGDMLARLSNTISDEQSDYQTFSMEILTTLKVVIGAMDSQDILRYPQLFWTTCACLSTIHEQEFFEALGMLEKLIDKVDLGDAQVVKALLKAKPSKWDGPFDGVQTLLHKGLRSNDSQERTLNLLYRCAAMSDSELIGDASRILYIVLAHLPQFLRQFDLDTFEQSSIDCADRLARVASVHGWTHLSQLLLEFARLNLTTPQKFLTQLVSAIEASFFPQQDAQSLIFMMGLLTNQTTWFRIKTMDALCALIPRVDMKQADITCHGPDLISPLLRILQTDLCAHALKVMDHIMEVSGNPMERHHMRMSMAMGPARTIRKEYERTQSLYGIPMASGWSIPMPAVNSTKTRNNVHAVYFTCGDQESMEGKEDETPEFEMQGDDGDSYFPPPSRTGTIKSTETATDANMGELIHRLDSLDDFFDDADDVDTDSSTIVGVSSSAPTEYGHESGASIYDKHTAPILQKSLARTNSTTSFHNGFAESRPPTSHRHYPQVSIGMTPEAFASSPMNGPGPVEDLGGPGPSLPNSTKKSHLHAPSISRPGMHARSITSPANQFPISQPTAVPYVPPTLDHSTSFTSDHFPETYMHYDEHHSYSASDTENAPFPPLSLTISNPSRALTSQITGPGPSPQTSASIHQRVTPTSADSTGGINGPFSFDGVRRGMRRLTGGKSESGKERERIREIARSRGVSSGQNSLPAYSGAPGAGLGGVAGLQQPLHSPKVPRVPLEYLSGNVSGGLAYSSTNANAVSSPAASP